MLMKSLKKKQKKLHTGLAKVPEPRPLKSREQLATIFSVFGGSVRAIHSRFAVHALDKKWVGGGGGGGRFEQSLKYYI